MLKYRAVNLENSVAFKFEGIFGTRTILIDKDYIYLIHNKNEAILIDYKLAFSYEDIVKAFERVESERDFVKLINRLYLFDVVYTRYRVIKFVK